MAIEQSSLKELRRLLLAAVARYMKAHGPCPIVLCCKRSLYRLQQNTLWRLCARVVCPFRAFVLIQTSLLQCLIGSYIEFSIRWFFDLNTFGPVTGSGELFLNENCLLYRVGYVRAFDDWVHVPDIGQAYYMVGGTLIKK